MTPTATPSAVLFSLAIAAGTVAGCGPSEPAAGPAVPTPEVEPSLAATSSMGEEPAPTEPIPSAMPSASAPRDADAPVNESGRRACCTALRLGAASAAVRHQAAFLVAAGVCAAGLGRSSKELRADIEHELRNTTVPAPCREL